MISFVDSDTLIRLKQDLEQVCKAPISIRFLPVGIEAAAQPQRLLERKSARLALAEVLVELGESPRDVENLKFPQRCLSISHSTGVAVACGVAERSAVRGLGIDVERARTVSARLGRFFLRDEEARTLGAVPNEEVLRLWTVKEAIFKADPQNKDRVLRHYRVQDLSQRSGRAAHVDSGVGFYFTSVPLTNGGWLTVAVGTH